MTTRAKGLIASGLIAAVVLAIVLTSALRSGPAGGSGSGTGGVSPSGVAPPPAEVVSTIGGQMTAQDLLSGGERGQWTRTRADGSIESRIGSESIEPLPDGRFAIGGLEFWLFGDSFSVRVRAPQAQLVWPRQDQEPESGELSGGVTIALFDRDHSTLAADAEVPEPVAIGRLESARLESALSQLESSDVLEFEAPSYGVSFRGKGPTLRVSELSRTLQLLRIEADPANRLVIDAGTSAGRRSGGAAGSGAGGSAARGPSSAPRVDLYRLTASGPVRVRQAGRELTGEQLSVWIKLFDGALRESAIRRLSFDDDAAASTGRGTGASGAPTSPTQGTASGQQAPLELTWDGPLEVRMAQSEPPELAKDDVFARLESSTDGGVRLVVPDPAVTLAAQRLDYAATTARLSVAGRAQAPVRLNGLGFELERVERIDVAMAEAPTLAVSVPGAGSISVQPAPSESDQVGVVAWNGQAQIAGQWSGGAFIPESMSVAGTIAAASAQGAAKAEALSATFEGASLRTLTLKGKAETSTAEGDVARAELIRAEFVAGASGRPVISRAVAEGAVTATGRAGELRSAERVTVDFVTMGEKPGSVDRFDAQGGVSVHAADGVAVHGDRVVADVTNQVLDVTGTPAVLASASDSTRISVTGASLKVDGLRRALWAFGPSTAAMARLKGDDWSSDRLQVRSSDALSYDDVTGRAEFQGDVRAIGEFRGQERHALRGDRLLVMLTPGQSNSGGREPVEAVLEGGSFDPSSSGHAQAETRVYDATTDAARRRLASLLSLEGRRMSVEFASRTIQQPGPGRIVIEDRRDPRRVRAGEAGPEVSAPGTTVFTWNGGLRVDGSSGTASMREKVRVRHLPHAEGAALMVLECEDVTAEFRVDSMTEQSIQGELRRIVAGGAAFVRVGDVEMVCDRVEFDAATNQVLAFAQPGNRLTLVDHAKGATVSAEVIGIDVRTGDWRRVDRGSVMIPR